MSVTIHHGHAPDVLARFEPARVDGLLDGLPVAVNMVWLVAHTTVRGRADVPPGIHVTVTPGVKRRAAA